MKKSIITLITLLSACFMHVSAQSVSIALDAGATSVATKTSSINVDFSVDLASAPANISDTVNFKVVPNYFGEIILSEDRKTAALNTFVTTGTAQLIISLSDSAAIADTVDITFTGDDQDMFYVATDGDAANWGSSAEDAIADPVRAIKYASPGDKVMIAAGEYLVTGGASAQASITIEGAGVGETIIKNNASFFDAQARYQTNDGEAGMSNPLGDVGHRFLFVGDTSVVLSMSDISFKYWTFYGAGGVVAANCHLTMENIEVSESFAWNGAALAGNMDGNIILRNCNFSDNKALWYGGEKGGLKNGGAIIAATLESLLMDGCVIDNNVSMNDDSNDTKVRNRANSGAGMNYNFNVTSNRKADIVIKNSTFSNNSVQSIAGESVVAGAGAGLFVSSSNYKADTDLTMQSNLLIENCTFANNDGVNNGGLYIVANSNNDEARVSFNVINNTIANNTSSVNVVGASSGGLFFVNEEMTLVLANNIIAGNTSDGVANDFDVNNNFLTKDGGAVDTMLNNIAEGVDVTRITAFATNNITGPQSGLIAADLADNGGAVPTFALLEGSAAINTGLVSVGTVFAPTTDARAYTRDATPDVGAYEYDASAPASIAGSNAVTVTMYPNPATDLVKFSVEMLTVQVYDFTGKLILQANEVSSLDVSNLNGLYLLKGKTQNGSSIAQKLIVQ